VKENCSGESVEEVIQTQNDVYDGYFFEKNQQEIQCNSTYVRKIIVAD
jgi:hypothetical protein